MIRKSIMTLMVMCSLLFINTAEVLAQNNKPKKEHKNKAYKKGNHKTKDYKKVDRNQKGSDEVVIGRVIYPHTGTFSPRKLKGVPKGHYPPPGSCRIWYPNRPPGHQPPATSCNNVYRTRLEPGAFVLHGDRAYDADYDWREQERRHPGSVSKDILDVLFPRNR
ncbi:MAG TPA: hypothetical protein VFD29_00365 [Gillisia sp.]|nr:hypothetical protein [Gillisia sp.]